MAMFDKANHVDLNRKMSITANLVLIGNRIAGFECIYGFNITIRHWKQSNVHETQHTCMNRNVQIIHIEHYATLNTFYAYRWSLLLL